MFWGERVRIQFDHRELCIQLKKSHRKCLENVVNTGVCNQGFCGINQYTFKGVSTGRNKQNGNHLISIFRWQIKNELYSSICILTCLWGFGQNGWRICYPIGLRRCNPKFIGTWIWMFTCATNNFKFRWMMTKNGFVSIYFRHRSKMNSIWHADVLCGFWVLWYFQQLDASAHMLWCVSSLIGMKESNRKMKQLMLCQIYLYVMKILSMF